MINYMENKIKNKVEYSAFSKEFDVSLFDTEECNMGKYQIILTTNYCCNSKMVYIPIGNGWNLSFDFDEISKRMKPNCSFKCYQEIYDLFANWLDGTDCLGNNNRYKLFKWWNFLNPNYSKYRKISRKYYNGIFKKIKFQSVNKEIYSYKDLPILYPQKNIDLENFSYDDFRKFLSDNKLTYFLDRVRESGILDKIKEEDRLKAIEDNLGITEEKEFFNLN